LEIKGDVMADDTTDGVKINLISSRKLDSMNSQEKLRFILDEVKKGTVLVLERGLTATEEINLIKATMSEINHDTFIGIEMQSYSSRDLDTGGVLSRLLGRRRVPKMSVIGPANLLKTIHKDGNIIQAMILTGESISGEMSEGGEGEEEEPEVEAIAEEIVEGHLEVLREPILPEQPIASEPETSTEEPEAPGEVELPLEPSEEYLPAEQETQVVPPAEMDLPPQPLPALEVPAPPPIAPPPVEPENHYTAPEEPLTEAPPEAIPVPQPAPEDIEPAPEHSEETSSETPEDQVSPDSDIEDATSGQQQESGPPDESPGSTSFLYRRIKEEEE
jgi:hypothetical protein